MVKIKAVLFDVDGVLFNSIYANTIFYNTFLKKHGYKPPKWRVLKRIGSTLTNTNIVVVTTKEKSKKKIEELIKAMDAHPFRKDLVKPSKNMKKVLNTLGKRYALGIVTSASETGLADLFGIKDVRRYFKLIVKEGDYKRAKPYPDPILKAARKFKVKTSEIVYVGDTIVDKQAARAAHVKFIGYDAFSKGFFNRKDIVAHKFSDIPKKIDLLSKK